jgi:cytoskeletal protein CcmA (bactofilin family)
MWDRKKQDSPASSPSNIRVQPQTTTAPSHTNGAAHHTVQEPVAAAPAPSYRAPEPAAASKGTAIGAGVKIIGDVYSEEDLFVDGEVEGVMDVQGSRLTIGPKGKAISNVRAREVIIHGQVQGDVEASHKITIRKDGSLVGNIKTTGIIIDDDAYFKGSIDIVRKEAEA